MLYYIHDQIDKADIRLPAIFVTKVGSIINVGITKLMVTIMFHSHPSKPYAYAHKRRFFSKMMQTSLYVNAYFIFL